MLLHPLEDFHPLFGGGRGDLFVVQTDDEVFLFAVFFFDLGKEHTVVRFDLRDLGIVFGDRFFCLDAALAGEFHAVRQVFCVGGQFFAAGCGYRQVTHGIGYVTRLGNIDRVTATKAPADPGIGYDGLPNPWPTRSNEGNGTTWWGGKLGPKGDGLSVRDLSKAEVLHRKYWWEHVAKMRKTPGWEQVYIANNCSQIGPRATRILESEMICDRAAESRGENTKEVVGWFGSCGAHNGMALPYRCLLPKKGENILAAGRCIGAPDTVDTFRLICPCFVSGQAAGTAAALAAAKGVSPRDLPYAALRTALDKAGCYLG